MTDVDLAEIGPAGPSDYSVAYEWLRARARRSAATVLGDGEDARDIAQETLARAYRIWPRLDGKPWTLTWVKRVSRNLAIDTLRRRTSEAQYVAETQSVDDMTRAVDRVQLEAALATLSPRQREVVALRYLDDLSIEDVAAALGCSESAVKTYTTRGLARLRQRLVGAGAIVLVIACIAGAVAFARGSGSDTRHRIIVVVTEPGIRVSVSLSATTVRTGGTLMATIEVKNVAAHTRRYAIGARSCGAAPAAVFTPLGDDRSVARLSCAHSGSPTLTLAHEATHKWTVALRAVSSDGAPLAPGRYGLVVLGIGARSFSMPLVVTVIPANSRLEHAPAVVAPAPPDGTGSSPAARRTPTLRSFTSGVTGVQQGASTPTPAPAPTPTAVQPPTITVVTPAITPSTVSVVPPPPSVDPMPSVLPVSVSFRTQADHMDSTRSLIDWTLSVKNTTDATLNETFVADVVTVSTPDGKVYRDIPETLPKLVMRISAKQTWSARLPVVLGYAPYVDGGVVAKPPPLGLYAFTYVFIDSNGARTPPTSFTLRVQ